MSKLWRRMSKQAHILMVPLPAQGHAKPLLKLAYKVANHGIKVTFLDTGSIHSKPLATKSDRIQEHNDVLFVSLSIGFHGTECMIERGVQAGNLIKLIENINNSNSSSKAEDLGITCVIADVTMGWILADVAEKLRIQTVAFCPLSVAALALSCHIPKLIEAGTIDSNGNIVRNDDVISLSVDIPPWKATELTWVYPRKNETEKKFFELCNNAQKTAEDVKWIICNSSVEFEPAGCGLISGSLPVGPLLESDDAERTSGAAGSFWLEDTSCLNWLDTKPPGSVIYIAFDSGVNVYQHEFHELALGLEISGHPFLWVVRSDSVGGAPPDYPIGFLERVAKLGKIIEWAPQEKVLAHPSVACFLTHCGWNSTMESLSSGVPFLCWPSFSDQFHNAIYICDTWKVGLKFNQDENGIISRYEVQTKIGVLLSNDSLKLNAARTKKLAQESVLPGGTSNMNFEKFINLLRQYLN